MRTLRPTCRTKAQVRTAAFTRDKETTELEGFESATDRITTKESS